MIIYQKWSLANVTQVWKITVSHDIFHHLYFNFAIADLKNFSCCNVIQQIKKLSPNDQLSYWYQKGYTEENLQSYYNIILKGTIEDTSILKMFFFCNCFREYILLTSLAKVCATVEVRIDYQSLCLSVR